MAVYFSTKLSESVAENRWSAEFHRPGFKFMPKRQEDWMKVRKITKFCQYGLSVQMNEDGRGVPIYRLNEIEDCFLNEQPIKHAPVSQHIVNDYTLSDGDVLFCRTNGNINYVGRTGLYCGGSKSVFASYLVRVRTRLNDLLPEYLAIYLNTNFGRRQILRRAMPSNQVNVSAAELKKIDVFLPAQNIQKEIAELVREAYSARKSGISSYTQAQQLLEVELGLDKLRFDKPVGYTARFSTVGLSETFFAKRIDSQCFAPDALFYERWLRSHVQCDRLGTLIHRTAKGRQQTESPQGNGDYCSIKHISGRELVGVSKCFLGADTPVAGTNDLLLAITGATIGKIGIVKRYTKLAFSGDLLMLRAKPEINPNYLLLALDHRIGQVQFFRWITGSTNGHLAPRDIRRVLVPRLDESIEKQIAQLVEKSHSKRLESEQLLDQAKARVEQLIEEAVKS